MTNFIIAVVLMVGIPLLIAISIAIMNWIFDRIL